MSQSVEAEVSPYDLEDSVLEAAIADHRPSVDVFQAPDTMVVLGRGSKPEVELNLDACRDDGVRVLRRRGGGCAVVLDPGNVIVAAAFPIEGIGGNRAHFERLCGWLVSGLERIGIRGADRAGVSDLVLADRKVGGSCIYRGRGILLFSCSLLVSPRVDLMERYLAHPPREPEYRSGRPHRDFVGRLDTAADAVSVESFRARLAGVLDVPRL